MKRVLLLSLVISPVYPATQRGGVIGSNLRFKEKFNAYKAQPTSAKAIQDLLDAFDSTKVEPVSRQWAAKQLELATLSTVGLQDQLVKLAPTPAEQEFVKETEKIIATVTEPLAGAQTDTAAQDAARLEQAARAIQAKYRQNQDIKAARAELARLRQEAEQLKQQAPKAVPVPAPPAPVPAPAPAPAPIPAPLDPLTSNPYKDYTQAQLERQAHELLDKNNDMHLAGQLKSWDDKTTARQIIDIINSKFKDALPQLAQQLQQFINAPSYAPQARPAPAPAPAPVDPLAHNSFAQNTQRDLTLRINDLFEKSRNFNLSAQLVTQDDATTARQIVDVINARFKDNADLQYFVPILAKFTTNRPYGQLAPQAQPRPKPAPAAPAPAPAKPAPAPGTLANNPYRADTQAQLERQAHELLDKNNDMHLAGQLKDSNDIYQAKRIIEVITVKFKDVLAPLAQELQQFIDAPAYVSAPNTDIKELNNLLSSVSSEMDEWVVNFEKSAKQRDSLIRQQQTWRGYTHDLEQDLLEHADAVKRLKDPQVAQTLEGKNALVLIKVLNKKTVDIEAKLKAAFDALQGPVDPLAKNPYGKDTPVQLERQAKELLDKTNDMSLNGQRISWDDKTAARQILEVINVKFKDTLQPLAQDLEKFGQAESYVPIKRTAPPHVLYDPKIQAKVDQARAAAPRGPAPSAAEVD